MTEYVTFFDQKISEGELWLQYCPNCKELIFYPRSLCSGCLQENMQWQQVSGKGRVYSYTVVHVPPFPEYEIDTPYIYALIMLDEGVKMISNLIACDPAEVFIDMPVTFVVMERGKRSLVAFQPFLND